MSITAKELAKKLGLSETAVSFALNNKPGISTQTKKKIIDAAHKYGYDFSRLHPTETISDMKNTIYLIIYRKDGAVVTDTPFFSKLSEGIDMECKRYNYFLNILYLYEGDDIKQQLLTLNNMGAKGIILLGTEMQHMDIIPFSDCAIPLIVLDNYFEYMDLDCVIINNVQGAFTATDYLIKKTHIQPGYLHSSYPINNFEERADGFYKALRANGMSTSRSIVHRLAPSVEGAYADMTELIIQKEPLASCYFADNDLIALGAMRAFIDNGYRIPEDIRIIGFDDMPLCTYASPQLTTIHVSPDYMGQMAVRRLHDRIVSSQDNSVKIAVSTYLIKRKTT